MASFRIQFATLTGPALVMDVPGPPKTSITELDQWQPSTNGSGQIDGFRRTLTHLYLWQIDLPDLQAADFQSIETFFAAVSGNADQFAYTHTDGLVYTVRFWDQPQYRRSGGLMYAASIQLLSHTRPQEPSP